MPTSEDDPVYAFGLSLLSTPERWRARFNSVYQARDCVNTASEVKVLPNDYTKYAEIKPAEGEKLRRMHAASRMTGIGTVLGFFGGGLQIYRWTRSAPLLLVGTFMATFTGHVVADDVGGWVYGTYKFDPAKTNLDFLSWVQRERKAASETS